MNTIKDAWKRITPICGCHSYEVEMVEKEGNSVFYACPKYYPQNRSSSERACNNHISITEYEKMVNKLMDMIAKASIGGYMIDLTSYSWEYKGITFCVLEHEGNHLKVSIKNEKALS